MVVRKNLVRLFQLNSVYTPLLVHGSALCYNFVNSLSKISDSN